MFSPEYESVSHLFANKVFYELFDPGSPPFLQHGKQDCTDMKNPFRRKSVFVYVYCVLRELLSSVVLWTLESFKEIQKNS